MCATKLLPTLLSLWLSSGDSNLLLWWVVGVGFEHPKWCSQPSLKESASSVQAGDKQDRVMGARKGQVSEEDGKTFLQDCLFPSKRVSVQWDYTRYVTEK